MLATDQRTLNYLYAGYEDSIAVGRWRHFSTLAAMNGHELTLALHDREADQWTKWKPFHCGFTLKEIQTGLDIHRSVISNEVVVESDYPSYEENASASRIVSRLLEERGFIPHHYYSGSKSVHTHVYVDFTRFLDAEMTLQDAAIEVFKTKLSFTKEFMQFLREKMITCWGTGARKFDEQLEKPSHLIRAELSRNKAGFKTFIGYKGTDIPSFAPVENEENGLQPRLGAIRLSAAFDPTRLLEEFLEWHDTRNRVFQLARKQRTLAFWADPESAKKVRPCIEYLLSTQFKTSADGYHRAMFYIINELKLRGRESEILGRLHGWNEMMGEPVRPFDIEYRAALSRTYNVSCHTVHDFLRGLGHPEGAEICERKV